MILIVNPQDDRLTMNERYKHFLTDDRMDFVMTTVQEVGQTRPVRVYSRVSGYEVASVEDAQLWAALCRLGIDRAEIEVL